MILVQLSGFKQLIEFDLVLSVISLHLVSLKGHVNYYWATSS